MKMWLKNLIYEEINKDQLKSVATVLNISEDNLEKWIEDDQYNSVYYYLHAKVDPVNISNPDVRDLVLLVKYIRSDDKKSISSEIFEHTLKSYLLRAKKNYKNGEIKQVFQYILKPYMEKTGKSVKDILGKQYTSNFYRPKKK